MAKLKKNVKVKKRKKRETSANNQHEDAAIKMMVDFFREELLAYFQIEGKVVGIAPTEVVDLKIHKLFQDFNLIMDDNSWKHFEFQSTNEGLVGLKRFRVYEAVTSYQHKVEVTTYVLYSGKIKCPMTEFTEGINTYRIQPIIMQDKNADEEIKRLEEKRAKGKPITKEDLVPLTLSPLMSGEMEQKDRIKTVIHLSKEAEGLSYEDRERIQAVVYAMAEKFLDETELEEVKEVLKMTRLGEMLVNDGIKLGIEQGIGQGTILGEEKFAKLAQRMLEAGRIEELKQAIEDKGYRDRLFEEFVA